MVSQVPAWFGRTFAFAYPVELLPSLLARLRGAPARLEETLRGRAHDVLTAKPNGGWSAQEQAGHMADLEALWIARVGDYAAGSDVLTPTDLANRKTDEANHNAQPLEEILRKFRAERARLLQRVHEATPEAYAKEIIHPRMKVPMRLTDHLYFVAEHDDHHLARMWEIVADPRG